MKKHSETTEATRLHILSAFWELCQEMPFEKISVNAIATKANIHRSTFYRYFTDIQNVLEEFEDELLENIYEDGLSPLSKSLFLSQSSKELLENGDEAVFKLLTKYSEKVYYLTNVRSDSHFKDKLYNWIRKEAEELLPIPPQNRLAFDYLLTLIFTLILTNINYCYEHRNEANINEVTALSRAAVKSCIEQLMLL